MEQTTGAPRLAFGRAPRYGVAMSTTPAKPVAPKKPKAPAKPKPPRDVNQIAAKIVGKATGRSRSKDESS